ncbi:apoptotic chromatin condensation inducer in the nucleus isoform X2 [Venturia canescens]|uniref:apoptotic chromatin condensation inducer in the nucleus isoform X2 n=1 Tax=Venturia canescens TaxID=32260 RepID=UPI001C9CE863|nr:apoptotic chromatin condensation inducer in the nucleus isoform X2 [Venturia canescens]
MRRKSERNKGKASPEKKVEKPTRKSTRRRGKRSPSTSPDRENSNDTVAIMARENEGETASQSHLAGRDIEKLNETAKSSVTSTEISIIKEEEEQTTEAGSVWKVARADASPGEIQKLKLCRQRNMSETSDASSSRKRSSKWHEGSEGITEEIDSSDERTTVGSSKTTVEDAPRTEENTSVVQGRDSSEEITWIKPSGGELKSSVNENPDGNKHDEEQISNEAETERQIEKEAEKENKEKDNIEDHINTEIKVVPNDQQTFDRCSKNENETSLEESAKTTDDNNDLRDSKESSSDENELEHEKRRDIVPLKRQRDDTSDDNSEDNDKKEKVTKAPLPRTTSRRKHRDKYRDSSNSDTGESEDEPERDNKRSKRNVLEESRSTRDHSPNIEESNYNKDISRTPEIRPESPTRNDIPTDNERKIVENDKSKTNDDNERIEQIPAANATVVQAQTNYKPAKVNLKRSFAARPSVESVESKKNAPDNEANDLANQDKENHASGEQNDVKSIPKKRRWGTILTPTDPTPAFSVSTESLKVLVPGAKPLPINEVRLSKDDDEERDRRNQREKRYSTSESGTEHKSRDDEKPKNAESKKDSKGDNHIVSRRKISIVKDTQHAKSPSPPAAVPTSILLIKNLVRPFTLNQIRELLSRTGTIVENGFWMDRIKSKCFVEYCNEDQAFETRQALHGISWPVSNPKKLIVEYATKEDMEMARELAKDQPASRKTEPLAVNDGWQQDWARDERTNSTTKVTVVREWDLGKEDGQHFAKDKEREKKELEKKRRQRSRSPTLEAHLPAPARKFKKKEDDPPPAKLLDDLFRKTKATPCIYWLPLTNEQIVVKEEMRRQHMAEHARRLEEMRRAERNRDARRRRSPRK